MSNESKMAAINAAAQVDKAIEALTPKSEPQGVLIQIRITPIKKEVIDENGLINQEPSYKMHLHLDDNLFKEIKKTGQVLQLYECLHTIKTNIMMQDGVITGKQLSEKGIIEIGKMGGV